MKPIGSEPGVMKTPRAVDIAITASCNLRCRYCAHFTSASDVGMDLPADEWCMFFEELNRCAVLNVYLQGGEPFHRNDLREIIQGIVRNRMRFTILSNGTLITEPMAAYIASTGRCDGVQVSIDGSTAATHDATRGEGTFVRAVEGIRTLQKYRIPVPIRVTISRYNVYDLEAIAVLLLEELRLPTFSTNSASHQGLCRQHAQELQLTVSERSLAMETLLSLNRKYHGCITSSAGPLSEAKTWLEMEKATRQTDTANSSGGYLTCCGGPFARIGVCANGMLVPCLLMSHIHLGRINQVSLQEVWQRHPELRAIRNRRAIALDTFEFCKGCRYISYCSGDCPSLSYNVFGNADHPNPDACLKRFLEHGGRLPAESPL